MCLHSKGPLWPHSPPEVAFLTVIFLHGIQGAHSSVLFQTHTIWKEIFSRSFSGCGEQWPHHHWGQKYDRTKKNVMKWLKGQQARAKKDDNKKAKHFRKTTLLLYKSSVLVTQLVNSEITRVVFPHKGPLNSNVNHYIKTYVEGEQENAAFLYLWMLPGLEPSPRVQQSECLHQQLLALQIVGHTLQPCTPRYLGAVHMPSLRNRSTNRCVGEKYPQYSWDEDIIMFPALCLSHVN